jgi:hypothetical protein
MDEPRDVDLLSRIILKSGKVYGGFQRQRATSLQRIASGKKKIFALAVSECRVAASHPPFRDEQQPENPSPA